MVPSGLEGEVTSEKARQYIEDWVSANGNKPMPLNTVISLIDDIDGVLLTHFGGEEECISWLLGRVNDLCVDEYVSRNSWVVEYKLGGRCQWHTHKDRGGALLLAVGAVSMFKG